MEARLKVGRWFDMVVALRSLSLSAIDGKRAKRFLVLRKKERTVELVEGEGKAESEGKREHLKFECVRFEREESG